MRIFRVMFLGKLVSEKEERIRGALKYTWTEGPSIAKSLRLQEATSHTSAEAGPSTLSTVRRLFHNLIDMVLTRNSNSNSVTANYNHYFHQQGIIVGILVARTIEIMGRINPRTFGTANLKTKIMSTFLPDYSIDTLKIFVVLD